MTSDYEYPPHEIEKMQARFRQLDKLQLGVITFEQLVSLPAFAINPFADRLFSIIAESSDTINFEQFVSFLHVFSAHCSRPEKLRFAFRVYDWNSDGVICSDDLFNALKEMVGGNMEDLELDELVKETMAVSDVDQDGVISFEDFKIAMFSTDIDGIFSL